MSITKYWFGYAARYLERWPRLLAVAMTLVRGVRNGLHRVGVVLPRAQPLGNREVRRFLEGCRPFTDREEGARVLFYSPRGWSTHLAVEALLSVGLNMRGAQTLFGTCGLTMPACQMGTVFNSPPMPCGTCTATQSDILGAAGFRLKTKLELLDPGAMETARRSLEGLGYEDLEEVRHAGLPIGKLVQVSLRWFLASGTIKPEGADLARYRDFVAAGIVTADAALALLRDFRPDVVVLLNGLFFEERIMSALAEAQRVPVVAYERGFHKNHLVFARNKVACRYDISEHWERCKDRALEPDENEWVSRYLDDWRRGSRSHLKYWPTAEERVASIEAQLELSGFKRIVVLFTNITWDSAVQERDVAFPGLWAWIETTIRRFQERPDTALVVRIHPAEVRVPGRPTRERMFARIRGEGLTDAANIKVVSPESDISSYTLMDMADVITAYSSTVGLEAALLGKPVVLAGQTHYRGKGFTFDASTEDEYFDLLDEAMTDGPRGDRVESIERARRYAYAFFRKSMIPFPLVDEKRMNDVRLNVNSPDELAPGRSRELDSICEFILDSKGDLSTESLVI